MKLTELALNQRRIYVRELFSGIEDVFPGCEVIRIEDQHKNPWKCTYCGYEGSAKIRIPDCQFLVSVDENGILQIQMHERAFFGVGTVEWPPSDDTPFTFGGYLADIYEAGYHPQCPMCGSESTQLEFLESEGPSDDTDYPGYHITGEDYDARSAFEHCVHKAYAGQCVPTEDENVRRSCLDCNHFYARKKFGIPLLAIGRAVDGIKHRLEVVYDEDISAE